MKWPRGERGMLQDLPGRGDTSFFFQAPLTYAHTHAGVSREGYERRKKREEREISICSVKYPERRKKDNVLI
jgi:hypothetical protein